MGQKDSSEKLLEDYNDVFADIVNVLLFHGEYKIHPDELREAGTESHYKADDRKLHEQERDVAKFWEKLQIRMALIGLENQTSVDKNMPMRIFNYEGASYRSQLLNKKKERYPVITLVLYFGNKKWDQPLNLKGTVNVPAELDTYVNDFKINLFSIAYLTDEQVNMFQSDFRIVADYFVQMRKNKDYQPSKNTIQHVDEVLKFMAVFAQDKRFEEIAMAGTEGVKNMSEVLDRVEKRGIEQGIERGVEQGKVITFRNMLKRGYSVDEAQDISELTDKQVEKILKQS